MKRIADVYDETIGQTMEHMNLEPREWRKRFVLECLTRWEFTIRNSPVKLDINEMLMKALTQDKLMWPVARVVFQHEIGGSESKLLSEYTTDSFLSGEICENVLKIFLSEPELTDFVRRQEGLRMVSNWYRENFSWQNEKGDKIRLTNFMAKSTDFVLSEFFGRHNDPGFSSIQVYAFTQMREHSRPKCTNVIPFFGISAIQKSENIDQWESPDGFDYSESHLDDVIDRVKTHFTILANRPPVPCIVFKLD